MNIICKYFSENITCFLGFSITDEIYLAFASYAYKSNISIKIITFFFSERLSMTSIQKQKLMLRN